MRRQARGAVSNKQWMHVSNGFSAEGFIIAAETVQLQRAEYFIFMSEKNTCDVVDPRQAHHNKTNTPQPPTRLVDDRHVRVAA